MKTGKWQFAFELIAMQTFGLKEIKPLTFIGTFDVSWLASSLRDDLSSLGRFAFLFALQFFGGLLSEQGLEVKRDTKREWD